MDYFDEQTFKKVDYKSKKIIGEFEFCSFRECNLSGSDISETIFIDTEFVDCNFSNANVKKASFQDVKFVNCKLLGLQFSTINSFSFSASFESCNLSHSSFNKMKLGRIYFTDCHLNEVDFAEAEMQNIILKNCDLLGAIFEQTNLEKADFRNAVNYSIDPENNKLKGAKFSLPDVISLLAKYNLDIE
ncbi:MAG: fluoroquinolone resistance protein [Saprospiraceae bacterium]|jgi:fluoroquinolone resistance protein